MTLMAWSMPPDSVPTYRSQVQVNSATSCEGKGWCACVCVFVCARTAWEHVCAAWCTASSAMLQAHTIADEDDKPLPEKPI